MPTLPDPFHVPRSTKMSRPSSPTTSELEALLNELIAEHRRLLAHVSAHEAAMKAFDLRQMDALAKMQEASRLRIAALETRRRAVALHIGRAMGLAGSPTITD